MIKLEEDHEDELMDKNFKKIKNDKLFPGIPHSLEYSVPPPSAHHFFPLLCRPFLSPFRIFRFWHKNINKPVCRMADISD